VRVGIISVFTDYHRRGRHHRGVLQPQLGPLVAALLPPGVEVDVVNDTWEEPDWRRDYDLLFVSCLHSDFDRARQISHYWRRRGAKTVLGGTLASTYPALARPYFDAVAIGDAEGCVPDIYADFERGALRPYYVSSRYDPARLPMPRLDLVAGRQRMPIGLEASRGCPFSCEFCALTALGTRFHARPAAAVAAEVRQAQRLLEGRVPWHQRKVVGFYDNNIGGSIRRLRELCAALAPLGVRWASSVTFNVIADPRNVRLLSRSGCRFLFVGLESFNPAALADMNKHQNAVGRVRGALDCCRDNGILVVAGLMLSPTMDTLDYIASIPERLDECGLRVPAFVSFETPFPGTPWFKRLAAASGPALLPGALLRDFTGYTLVVRPLRAAVDEFIGAYRSLLPAIYSPGRRLAKIAADGARFLARGYLFPALVAAMDQLSPQQAAWPQRTFVAGTDTPPPETVPLTDADFASEAERDAILAPVRVTDDAGRILPCWLAPTRVYDSKGRPTAAAAAWTAETADAPVSAAPAVAAVAPRVANLPHAAHPAAPPHPLEMPGLA
jgi:radical SAM superfamily enzyme YgiQ (UPF0313 family)